MNYIEQMKAERKQTAELIERIEWALNIIAGNPTDGEVQTIKTLAEVDDIKDAETALRVKLAEQSGRGFELIPHGDITVPGDVKFVGIAKVAHWVADEIGENRADDLPDSLYDGFGDVVKDCAGNLYMAEKVYTRERNGEYAVWCRIDIQQDVMNPLALAAKKLGSYRKVAFALGVSVNAVQAWKSGNYAPRHEMMERIKAIANK